MLGAGLEAADAKQKNNGKNLQVHIKDGYARRVMLVAQGEGWEDPWASKEVTWTPIRPANEVTGETWRACL